MRHKVETLIGGIILATYLVVALVAVPLVAHIFWHVIAWGWSLGG